MSSFFKHNSCTGLNRDEPKILENSTLLNQGVRDISTVTLEERDPGPTRPGPPRPSPGGGHGARDGGREGRPGGVCHK